MSEILFNDLKAAIGDRQVLIIVGAGVSAAATGANPHASWTGLLKSGAERTAELLSSTLPPGWKKRVFEEIDSGDMDDLLSAAEKISKKLGAPNAGEYRRWLRETVGALQIQDNSVLQALADLANPIATTNYDGLFEIATGLLPVSWTASAKVERVVRGDDKAIVHLHGYWEEPESVILGIRSYEQMLGDAHTQAMMQALRCTRSLLFVGCGAGLADPNFGAFLTWTRSIFAGSEYRHFRLAKASEVATIQGQHPPEERICVLSYGNNHSDLVTFLHGLICEPGYTGKPRKEPTLKKQPLQIPSSYIKWINDQCCYMDIANMDEKGKPVRVDLPETFVPLYAYAPESKEPDNESAKKKKRKLHDESMPEEQQDKKPENIENLIATHESLLISGHAGTGKTTLLKHCAFEIVKGDSLPGLKGYLPVLIILHELKEFLPVTGGGTLDLKQIIDHYFGKKAEVLTYEQIHPFYEAKRAVFFLDGLDELAPEQRDIVVEAFANASNKECGNKLVISSRPHGLHGVATNRMGKNKIEVLPLQPEQITLFIKKWFGRIYEKSHTQGTETAEGLIERIRQIEARKDSTQNPIEELMVNPLMLTAICILYKDGKQLPDQRADLYKKFIGHLLYSKPYSLVTHDDVYDFLKKLAFFMQEHGTKDANQSDATNALREIIKQKKDETDQSYKIRLETIFDEIEPKCGLLQLEAGKYKFWHWQFQEFLAAAHIWNSATYYDKAIEDYWDRDDFKEVIKLYISLLSINNRGWVETIIQSLLDDPKTPLSKLFLGIEGLIDIHPDTRNKINLLTEVQKKLIGIYRQESNRQVKAQAGELLGWLGDPRNLKEFVKIEDGTYKLEELGMKPVEPFEIGKYPVTNSWYGEFVKADGYKNESYWSEEGWQWREKEKIEYPTYWHDRKWKCPNAPVVGVSFWEAEAFCRWLTKVDKEGKTYKLPDEKQWQAAAAGKEGRKYPWGPEKDFTRCNCDDGENKIEKTSAVGIFERGKTPSTGIYDMAGNVWEWCDKIYKDSGVDRVVRGGSWDSEARRCRCALRDGNHPGSRFDNLGFRLSRGQ